MKKSVLISIVVAILLVVAGVGAWLLFGANRTSAPADTQTPAAQTLPEESKPAEETLAADVSVDIRGMAFSPAQVKVKKGSKVTWTNQDSVGHNVVSKDLNNTGGLPASHALLSKGQTFSMTFEQLGTFTYGCMPHPAMRGTVEVVE